MPASFASVSYDPNDILAGNAHLLVARKVTLLSGENRTRGAVLGKITSGGKYQLSLSAATDGSEAPDVILAEDCDASAADKEALVYTRGDFVQQRLTLGAGHTAAGIAEGLRAKGIILIDGV